MSQFAHSILRVTASGTCFGGLEIWTTSFHVGLVGSDVSNPTQSFADSVRTAWTTFFSGSAAKISAAYQTSTIKVAQIGADGVTNLSNVVYAPYGTAISGFNSGQAMPPQIALAATLAVSGARGLASKGRMYLPGVNAGLQSNGAISGTDAGSIATALKTFFDSVNTAAPAGAKVILASQGRRVKGTDGKYTPVPGTAVNAVVNQVKIGSVYDTQRRRRNGMVEVYQTATVA